MPSYSLSQAARKIGKSKPTLLKAIKNGRLKAVKGNREWRIELDDLLAVWPQHQEATGRIGDNPTGSDATKIAVLEEKVNGLRELLERERETVSEIKASNADLQGANAELRERNAELRTRLEVIEQRRRPAWWPFK